MIGNVFPVTQKICHTKSFTKGAKAAGKVFEVEPAEAADIIVEKLKEKFII